MINKKKLFKSLIIISLIIIIIVAIMQIRNTLARYETTANSERDVDVALWIVDNDFKSDRILIEDIYPSDTPFEYIFTVSNFQDTKIAETDMEYEILLTSTTNLPLSYEITRNGTTCSKGGLLYPDAEQSELYTDDDGTIYRKITIGTSDNPFVINTIDNMTNRKSKITDTFVVKVTFPKEYSVNEQYADLMEDIKIDLTARQRIN